MMCTQQNDDEQSKRERVLRNGAVEWEGMRGKETWKSSLRVGTMDHCVAGCAIHYWDWCILPFTHMHTQVENQLNEMNSKVFQVCHHTSSSSYLHSWTNMNVTRVVFFLLIVVSYNFSDSGYFMCGNNYSQWLFSTLPISACLVLSLGSASTEKNNRWACASSIRINIVGEAGRFGIVVLTHNISYLFTAILFIDGIFRGMFHVFQ